MYTILINLHCCQNCIFCVLMHGSSSSCLTLRPLMEWSHLHSSVSVLFNSICACSKSFAIRFCVHRTRFLQCRPLLSTMFQISVLSASVLCFIRSRFFHWFSYVQFSFLPANYTHNIAHHSTTVNLLRLCPFLSLQAWWDQKIQKLFRAPQQRLVYSTSPNGQALPWQNFGSLCWLHSFILFHSISFFWFLLISSHFFFSVPLHLSLLRREPDLKLLSPLFLVLSRSTYNQWCKEVRSWVSSNACNSCAIYLLPLFLDLSITYFNCMLLQNGPALETECHPALLKNNYSNPPSPLPFGSLARVRIAMWHCTELHAAGSQWPLCPPTAPLPWIPHENTWKIMKPHELTATLNLWAAPHTPTHAP